MMVDILKSGTFETIETPGLGWSIWKFNYSWERQWHCCFPIYLADQDPVCRIVEDKPVQ